jgi:hypothetical protein
METIYHRENNKLKRKLYYKVTYVEDKGIGLKKLYREDNYRNGVYYSRKDFE